MANAAKNLGPLDLGIIDVIIHFVEWRENFMIRGDELRRLSG